MIGVTLMLMMVLVLGVLAVILQFYLSGKNNRWYGLIMPTLCLLTWLLAVLGLLMYDGVHGPKTWMGVLSLTISYNIPTVVLLGIYLARREKRRANKQMDKMYLEDL